MNRLELKIFGNIQGVGLRRFVQKKAESFFLKGFVQNQPDGSVLVVAEGTEKNLRAFVGMLSKSPYYPDIETLESKWETPQGLFVGFEIRA